MNKETDQFRSPPRKAATKWILRHSSDRYAAICEYLQDLGFVDHAFTGPTQSIRSNWKLLGSLLFDIYYMLRHINSFRNADTILSIGYTSIAVKIFMKVGLIKCRKLIWFAFLLHSPKSFGVFRILSKVLAVEEERYIVFSRVEQSLYSREIGIPISKLIYVPWGNWDEEVERVAPDASCKGEYYFSGGASNRDYLSLIDVFKARSEKLIIVCSSAKNKEILAVGLPQNIVIYTDIDAVRFDELIKGAKACIMLLKHNTGASGQSVLLRYMRMAKVIIASSQDVVREYIENEISGILIDDPVTELPRAIDRVGNEPQFCAELGLGAHKRFITTFSRKAVSTALEQALER